MTTEERTLRTGCATHPGTAAVARCDACGRALCLSCAVPVRGRVIGQECLSAVLGDGLLPELPSPPRRRSRHLALAAVAFAVALAATVLPWTRFGQGSGLFGAWGLLLQWSVLAAGAAAAGTAISLALWLGRIPARRLWPLVLAAPAIAVAVGAVLHVVHPPSIPRASVGPWVAVAGAAGALAASAGALWTTTRR